MSTPSESERYGASFFDVYDEWYGHEPDPDLVAFICGRLHRGASILELGVGTGRVAVALAHAGFAVTGLDSSPQMLAQLAAKGVADVVAVHGDATDRTSYPVGPFDGVLAVFNLLFNLTDPHAQRDCLAAAADRLAPGGILVVESFVPAPISGHERNLETRSVDLDRVVLIATETDPATQTVTGNHIEITPDGTRLRPWRIRPITPTEVDTLAAEVGLRLVERFEDFAQGPFVEGDSAQHVSVYRRD